MPDARISSSAAPADPRIQRSSQVTSMPSWSPVRGLASAGDRAVGRGCGCDPEKGDAKASLVLRPPSRLLQPTRHSYTTFDYQFPTDDELPFPRGFEPRIIWGPEDPNPPVDPCATADCDALCQEIETLKVALTAASGAKQVLEGTLGECRDNANKTPAESFLGRSERNICQLIASMLDSVNDEIDELYARVDEVSELLAKCCKPCPPS